MLCWGSPGCEEDPKAGQIPVEEGRSPREPLDIPVLGLEQEPMMQLVAGTGTDGAAYTDPLPCFSL